MALCTWVRVLTASSAYGYMASLLAGGNHECPLVSEDVEHRIGGGRRAIVL